MKGCKISLVELVSAITLISVFCTAAVNQDAPTSQDSKASIKEKIIEAVAKNGGTCIKAGTGSVAVVSCQKRVDRELIAIAIANFKRMLNVKVCQEERNVPDFNKELILPEGCAAAIYIIDDPARPISMIAPEGHWGILNIGALVSKSDKLTEDRVIKAFLRVALMTFGGGTVHHPGSIMQKVSNAEDLDMLGKPIIPIEQIGGMRRNLEALGVTSGRRATYAVACKQGWAPAPTNDIQKAIWEKIYAPPEKPLKITYDKDKQKPVVK